VHTVRNYVRPSGRRQPSPFANFGFRITGINCASIVLSCAAIFSIVPARFFNYPGGGFRNSAPLANFGFETTGINCAPIMLNCAAIPFTCVGSFFHDAITRGRILRNCAYFLFENCDLVLRDPRSWILQKIVPGPKTGEFEKANYEPKMNRINCSPLVLNCMVGSRFHFSCFDRIYNMTT